LIRVKQLKEREELIVGVVTVRITGEGETQ
jgi:hypothetical protein